MIDVTILHSLLIALALGALIGFEREYARYRKRGHDFAGIRTFPLITLFGALSAFLGELISIWILFIGMMLMGFLVLLAYFIITRKTTTHFGATSEMAGFLAFFIGVLCYYQEYSFALALTVIITIILYARSVLHHFAEHVTKEEMADTLKFIVIAFLILPFLPNKAYGPFELFNPFLIWLMVVFISGISFVGYILMKWFGEQGIIFTGLVGGLASSTAVTTALATRSKREIRNNQILAIGVIAANGIMFIRVLIEVFALNRTLFLSLLLPIILLCVVTALFIAFFIRKLRKTKQAPGKVHLSSPFTFGPALKFGLVFAAVIAFVKIANIYLSSKGVYAISFISGLADADAVTVSLSQLAKDALTINTAKNGILLAVLANTLSKAGIAYWLGGKEFRRLVLGFFSALIGIGVILIILL